MKGQGEMLRTFLSSDDKNVDKSNTTSIETKKVEKNNRNSLKNLTLPPSTPHPLLGER